MRRQSLITIINIIFISAFMIAVIWIVKEINNLKIQNLKLELILMSGKQDYTQSFIIFQRLKNLSGNLMNDETGDNDRILFEARYEAVILNSNYNIFPDYYDEENLLRRSIRSIDKKINPSFYQKIDQQKVNLEKYMEVAYFMELNKNYEDAVRYYTIFLANNSRKEHDYYNIATLHLAFCYLLNGYLDYADTLLHQIKNNCRNRLIISESEKFLEYITMMKSKHHYRQIGELKNYSLDLGIRNYSIFNYNRSIYILLNYILTNNNINPDDMLKAFYFIGRSYEETGRFDHAFEYYKYILNSEENIDYRDKVLKRLLLLHYVYNASIPGLDKAIADNKGNIDSGLINELKEISAISRLLPQNRKKIKSDALKMDVYLKQPPEQNSLVTDPVLGFFYKFSSENSERHKNNQEIEKKVIVIADLINSQKIKLENNLQNQEKTPVRIKVYLKNNTELIGELILNEKNLLRLKVFGNLIDIQTDEIEKWEYIDK